MELDFETALRKIRWEERRGNNPVPDILGFLHLERLFGDGFFPKLESLLEEYEVSTSKPKTLLKIDVPKANFTIRPMARPFIKDWLIYEAIVEYLSKKILGNNEICKASFTILRFKNIDVAEVNPWLKFGDRSRELYEKGYIYAVRTDLTGYYENISLEELRKRIKNYLDTEEEKLVNVLFILLRKWSDERIPGYGLPQGPPASSFLADIFLDVVDRKMEKHDGYFRYMDDIRIFCKKEIEAKIALKDLTIALREFKLNINAKKTEILVEQQIEKRLFDPHKPFLNTIGTIINSKEKRLIQDTIPDLIKLFEDAFLNNQFEKTHLNFALFRLGKLYNSGFDFNTAKVIAAIKNNFISKPHHARLFCDFLSIFSKDKDIMNFLIDFLKSDNNIYEWQEIKVLQALLKFNARSIKLTQQEIAYFITSACDANKHFAARAFYFLLAGKFGSNRDRDFIEGCYKDSYEVYVKKAIILAVQELGQASRTAFYSRIKRHEDDELAQFIDYVKSLSCPIYCMPTERPKIETYEEFEEMYNEYS